MQRCLWLVLLLLLTSLPAQASVAGRAAPECAEALLADVSGAVGIDAGTCLIVNLGTLEPGAVLEVDVLVIDDAVDLLVFDAAARSPYDLGQGYRAGMTLPASTEALLGEQGFHWQVPPSIQPKSWSFVFDNLAHDGDQGMGDQGGARATISLLVTPVSEGTLTVVHDLYGLEANTSTWLTAPAGLSLDAGTSLLLEAWPLEGSGDLLLLSEAERTAFEGGGTIEPQAGRSMLDVDGDSTLSWVLPSALEGTPMHLLFDATNRTVGGAVAGDVRSTVRLTLDPPLTPMVHDNANGSTTIGVAIELDADATPDRLMRLEAWSWDLEGGVDANGGVLNGDEWGVDASTSARWNSPGTKTITLSVRDVDGRTASTTHTVDVSDVVAPVAAVASLGEEQPITDGYRIGLDELLHLSCEPSTDDHRIDACSWSIDGAAAGQNTTLISSWSSPGEHTVRLTVTDPSGGADVIERRVVVTDPSPPSITPGSVSALPASVEVGAQTVVSVVVEDDVDAAEDLVVHWDLDPLVDSDGNGIKDDDPDAVGPQVALSFNDVGTQTVVITVEDPSGNRDRVVWSVEVTSSSSTSRGGSWMGIALLLIVVCVAVSAVVLRARRSRGPEATVEQEPSDEERAEAAKAAEMASIYGASTASAAPQDVYASQTTLMTSRPATVNAASSAAWSEASQALFDEVPSGARAPTGAEGLASLMDEDATSTESNTVADLWSPVEAEAPPTPVQSLEATSVEPVAGGRVSLPAGFDAFLNGGTAPTPLVKATEPTPAIATDLPTTCPACSQRFIARLPEDLQAARAACPSCGGHVTVRRPPLA